jgi:hypothetical protein
MNFNRFVFAVEIAKVAAAPRPSSGVECRYVELVPTLMIDDAETKMRTNAAVRVELKTWVLSPQNSGMQNSGCFGLFVLDIGFSMLS